MEILPASLADIPDLIKLIDSCYRSDISRKGWTTDADILEGTRITPKMLEEDMTKPGALFLKCQDSSGAIIGCVSTELQNKAVYTGTLCVHPEVQAGGLGRKLVEAVDDLAKEKGCSVVKLNVVSTREELIKWYERRGFKITGEREPFPTNKFGTPKGGLPLELVWMEKLL